MGAGGEVIRRVGGQADLTRQLRSALVAALACASLLVASLVAEAAATRRGAKSAPAQTDKSASAETAKVAGKAGKPAGKTSKKVAAKSKDSKDSKDKKSVADKSVPQIPLAQGPEPQTSEAEIALVKSAIEGLRKGGASKATDVQATISDPAARKLVEWIILRSDGNRASSARYLAFIAANPNWPSHGMFRRRAEAMLWVENVRPAQAMSFFKDAPPQSGMGRLVLARALLAQGDRDVGAAQVREVWRNDQLSADVEKQVLDRYGEFLSNVDHKARMEKRLFADDNEAALRAARRLGGAQVAIAQARIALDRKPGDNKKPTDGKKQFDAVPADARDDPGYIFAQVQFLRRADKTAEAAKVLLAAPRELSQIHDSEEWWVERRIMARKLLDAGDHRSAYQAVAEAAEPTKENSRVERHFMAGWIALRFLDDPATAATHFARIPDVSGHPTSMARAHYWLGRVAEASQRPGEARARYQAAASASASYYGQLARARLGLTALALAPPPATPDKGEAKRLELVRALEILYALKERPLAIALMAGAGEALDDAGTLSALGELAHQYEDARGMLHMGKAALGRGLPLDHYAFPTVGVPSYATIGPGIDNALLFAIIRQESMFDPADWSHAHAMGLMQVTPAAGKHTCKRYSCTFDVKRLRTDSPYNLQIGAAELAGLLQDYRGNHILTFAGYNAGPGRVQEWIARFGDPRDPKVDPIDWVERIPFMETRNYVQRVMENLQVYRTRFGSNAPLTIEADLRRGTAAK
jgi:soluble lytic murein transglycosylase